MLFEFKILPSVRLFINSERWRVVGFCPVPQVLGCSGINLSALFPIVGSFEGGAQHNEPGNRTIMLEHSHLAIELYNFKTSAKPLVRKTEFGALSTPWPDKASSSLEAT